MIHEEAVIRKLEAAAHRQEQAHTSSYRTTKLQGRRQSPHQEQDSKTSQLQQFLDSIYGTIATVSQVTQNQVHLLTDNNTVTWQAPKNITPLQEQWKKRCGGYWNQAIQMTHRAWRRPWLLPPQKSSSPAPPAITKENKAMPP